MNSFIRPIEEIRVKLTSISARYEISTNRPNKNYWTKRALSSQKNIEKIPNGAFPIVVSEQQVDESRKRDIDPTWQNKIDEEINERGIEALAWYTSFHNKSEEWGIFIPISSLHYIAKSWFKKLPLKFEHKLLYAYKILYLHESFHYAVDRNIAAWEIAFDLPFHMNTTKSLVPNQYLQLEEALANAYMLTNMFPDLSKIAQNNLIRAIRNCPPGYRDAEKYLDAHDYLLGIEDNIKTYVIPTALSRLNNIEPQFINWGSQFPFFPIVDSNECPITIIHDEGSIGIPDTSLKWLQPINSIHETKNFKKQLTKLHINLQKSWETKKDQLKREIPRAPEFERLKGDRKEVYSIRLNQNFRAHLKPKNNFSIWEATEIGSHKDMGHG